MDEHMVLEVSSNGVLNSWVLSSIKKELILHLKVIDGPVETACVKNLLYDNILKN